ncbi:hypothetical protein [Dysgonomonas sp.]
MKVFVLIQQKPLQVKTYTSLTALYEANKDILEVSKSKLDKYPFDRFDYVNHKIVISKTIALTTGDVRNMQKEQ